jgi:hypothetical protein
MPEQLSVDFAPEPTGLQRPVLRRWFYFGAGLFVIVLSFAGFGPSLIDQSRRNAPPTPLLIAHGATALAWLLLFPTQAALVATRRVAVHRRLGWVGPALAAVIIVLGFYTSIDSSRRPVDLSGDVTRLLVAPGSPPPTEAELIASVWGPLGVLLTFSILVAAGLWYRHRPEIHKRIMVFALLPLAFESILHLSGALVGRVPLSRGVIGGTGLAIFLLLFSVVAIHDRLSQGRIHPASVWVPALILVGTLLLNAVVFPSTVAYQVAAWLLR